MADLLLHHRVGVTPSESLAAAGSAGVRTQVPRYDAVILHGKDRMSVKKVAVTLPEELFDMVERLRDIEHRSRSDVFQDALRRYFGEPVYEPTEDERRLLDEAIATLDQGPTSGRSWEDVRSEIWPE
jgi:Arc/MetJ-type ribon-helix-helix transcriptional regulator